MNTYFTNKQVVASVIALFVISLVAPIANASEFASSFESRETLEQSESNPESTCAPLPTSLAASKQPVEMSDDVTRYKWAGYTIPSPLTARFNYPLRVGYSGWTDNQQPQDEIDAVDYMLTNNGTVLTFPSNLVRMSIEVDEHWATGAPYAKMLWERGRLPGMQWHRGMNIVSGCDGGYPINIHLPNGKTAVVRLDVQYQAYDPNATFPASPIHTVTDIFLK